MSNINRLKKYSLGLSVFGALVGGLAITRSYLAGELYEGKEELFGKTVVITGGNNGIGKETAKDLARRGARVVLACRDMKKCHEAKFEIIDETFNKNVECVKCDLSSLSSIKEFADKFNEKEKFCHVLVNNAGVMWCPRSYTKEGFETHLGVNHMGHFYLTNLLLPKIISSTPSRIVVLSSRDHFKGAINFDDLNLSKKYNEETAYNQSKLANVMFMHELNERLKGTGVTANCADPGYVYSDLMRYSSFYKSSFSPVAFLFKTFLKTPKMGAQTVIFTCVNSNLENVSGKYFRDFEVVEPSEESKNKIDSARLWTTSEKWTRLK